MIRFLFLQHNIDENKNDGWGKKSKGGTYFNLLNNFFHHKNISSNNINLGIE